MKIYFYIIVAILIGCTNHKDKSTINNRETTNANTYIAAKEMTLHSIDSMFADINNDKLIDTIRLLYNNRSTTFILQVNNKYFPDTIQIENENNKIKIYDIDTLDSIKEIGLWKSVPNDFNMIRFYSFINDSIKFTGEIGCLWDEFDFTANGSIKCKYFSSTLCSYRYETIYKLGKDHLLLELPLGLYKLNINTKLKTSLTLQKTYDDTTCAGTLAPGDSVFIEATYNNIWFLANSKKGIKGWFAVSGDNHVYGTKDQRFSTDVFEGIHLD
jgi:hypothetical protein